MSSHERRSEIIQKALSAATATDAIEIERLIRQDVGAAYQRPVGDRYNNYGLMASSGSYEYKALEPVTNEQDSVVERFAAEKWGPDLANVPYGSPEEAAQDLLGHLTYREQADLVTVAFRESDPPTRAHRRLTVVYRDRGCGMTAGQVPRTIFALGSAHKTERRWLQGAFGLGGASTFRNAPAVVLVTRRAPQMAPEEDRIVVAVVRWESQGKGESAYYLTTTDWAEGANPDAEPWSAPAAAFPDFEPGTHLALISYGVEGFHRVRSGDERAFDIVLNTRLYRPVTPVRYTNEIARGRNEYLRGLARRLEENPNPERKTDEEVMLFSYAGATYRLPVRYVVFPAEGNGIRRRFVAKDHALVFTSNGQVHHTWAPAKLQQRTKLNKIHQRVFVEVETDPLPIELRTKLFTPDRSQLLANDVALQLEDQVADFLGEWDRLVEINSELIRDAIRGASSGGSGLDVARKISTAMKLKGFGFGSTGSSGAPGGNGGRRRRRKVETYPDPTALEGPDKVIVEDGKVRRLPYMLNAEDKFFDSGRGRFRFTCDHPDIDVSKHIEVGRLRDGYVRVQLEIPEGAMEGKFELVVRLEDWERAAGSLGPTLEYTTRLDVVDEIAPPKGGSGSSNGSKGAGDGSNVAVLWQDPDEFGEDWHNAVPGTIEEVAAVDLAESREEYKELAKLGDQEVPTIILNKEYAQFKRYISARAKNLTTDKGVEDAKDRYAVGLGLGLLILKEETAKRAEQSQQPVDEKSELAAKQAVARSVLVMMPAFDDIIKEAGLA